MSKQTCPMTAKEVIDAYFIENRWRVLEIASFLDRVDRSKDPETGKKDFRYKALKNALKILVESPEGCTEALQQNFSDLSAKPLEVGPSFKGTFGAWEGAFHEDH
jgi:hypothetical protein